MRRWIFLIVSLLLIMGLMPLTTGAEELTYGDFKYTVDGDTVTITKYTGKGGDVEIPSQIDGKSVTKIGEKAFHECESLTGLTIPETVTVIGPFAFEQCGHLQKLIIPKSVVTIEHDAFNSCGNDADEFEVIFEEGSQLTTIGDYAFAYCNKLRSIVIPASVANRDEGQGIGYGAFFACSNLTSVSIPEFSYTRIFSDNGIDVFSECGLNEQSLTIYYGGAKAHWDKYATNVPSWTTFVCSKYAVVFYPNYDSPDQGDEMQIFDPDTLITLNGPQFTRKGHTFTGLNTKEDGTGTAYKNGTQLR